MRKLRILLSEFRKRSIWDFAKILFLALFVYNKFLTYAKELNGNDFSEVKCKFADEIKKGDIEELNRIKNSMASPPWEFKCHEYDGVKDFFWFRDNNDVIGCIIWIYYAGDPNREMKLGPKEADVRFGITDERYRGNRLLPATLIEIQKYLKANGYERVFGSILVDNHASIKALERAGFKFKKKILSIKVFGMPITKRYSTIEQT